jgi:serine/threonine protein kinase
VPHHHPYSTVGGDIWALGCILAEMVANVRPWTLASPEDRVYSDFLMERAVLLDILPVSDGTYSLLTKIFSPRPECRPSLDEIRREVLAMDTFFLTDREAFICGWADRLEKNMRLKMGVPMISSCCSDETSSVSCYPPTSSSSCSSSASCYSCGSSSSAFESISLESSAAPATPSAPAVEAFYSMGKVVS